MPLTGATGPATVVGSAVQHAAECLSGITIHQLAKAGSPIVWGGSPASFDMRTGTTPMGSIATMMLDCTYAQIGKNIKPGGLPTHAYLGMADTKIVDAQTGLESASGAILGALAGVNMMSGAGMMDFESCFSLEKLVLDNEICGMTLRMVKGIEPKEDFPSLPRFEELLRDQHLLISDHTRKYLKEEIHFPGPVIDRANRSRWQEEGGLTLCQRASKEVERLVAGYEPIELTEEIRRGLTKLMAAEAKRNGMDKLPEID